MTVVERCRRLGLEVLGRRKGRRQEEGVNPTQPCGTQADVVVDENPHLLSDSPMPSLLKQIGFGSLLL
jgi:hypothetical protein